MIIRSLSRRFSPLALWLFPVVLIVSLLAGAGSAAAATPPSLHIVLGVPSASPEITVPGQSTMLTYDVSIQNGTATETGGVWINKKIKSQTFTIQADNNDTTITSVSTDDPNDYTVNTVTAGQTYTITASGYATSKLTITVVAKGSTAPKSDGATLSGTLTPHSGANVTAGPVDNRFYVHKESVDVQGSPYIVVPATGTPYLPNGTPDPNLSSNYTATAHGGQAPYKFEWTQTPSCTWIPQAIYQPNPYNYHGGSGGMSSDGFECYGASIPQNGLATLTCLAKDANGVESWGFTKARMAPQFTWNWKASQVVINTIMNGGMNVPCAVGFTVGSSINKTYKVTVKTALSIGFTSHTEIVDATTSLSLTEGITYTGSVTQMTSYTNKSQELEGVAIGQEYTATSGSVVITTPTGPQAPQKAYKYAMHGNGLGGLGIPKSQWPPYSINGWMKYPDPNVDGLYIVN